MLELWCNQEKKKVVLSLMQPVTHAHTFFHNYRAGSVSQHNCTFCKSSSYALSPQGQQLLARARNSTSASILMESLGFLCLVLQFHARERILIQEYMLRHIYFSYTRIQLKTALLPLPQAEAIHTLQAILDQPVQNVILREYLNMSLRASKY